MESAMRIDSLERENDLRLAYLENMTSILRDRVKTDSLHLYDSAVVRIQDTLLTASEREMMFVSKYEERERFGLTALDNQKEGPVSLVFLAPVRGKAALPGEGTQSSVTRIELSEQVQVLAPLDGTIISVDFLLGEGYKVALQHANDYITIFSRLNSVMVKTGQSVNSGRVLGHAGSKDPLDSWMGLQVWHKGKSVDPITIMPIE